MELVTVVVVAVLVLAVAAAARRTLRLVLIAAAATWLALYAGIRGPELGELVSEVGRLLSST